MKIDIFFGRRNMKKKKALKIIAVVLVAVIGAAGISSGIYFGLLNKAAKESYIGTVSTDPYSANYVYDEANTVILQKQKDKDFVILSITDIHLSDFHKNYFYSFSYLNRIKKLVAKVQPDLITILGDTVCKTSTVKSIERLTNLMDTFGIPWAPIFGNHDGEGNCDLNYLADKMMESKYCVMKKGPADLGVGNYIINIVEGEGEDRQIVQTLFMMHTPSEAEHLSPGRIQWYKDSIEAICEKEGRLVESTVFLHIPLVEYQLAYDEAWDAENNRWREGYDAWGEKNEKICCPKTNSGFFDLLKEIGSTKTVVCGHEHINNFHIVYQGIHLKYNLKLGEPPLYYSHLDGGTKITISSSGVSAVEDVYKKDL